MRSHVRSREGRGYRDARGFSSERLAGVPVRRTADVAAIRRRACRASCTDLRVYLGGTRAVRRVVLDTGADRGDFPHGYALEASADGVHWAGAASGAGSGQLATVDLPPTQARFVRVVQSAIAPQ